MVSSPNGMAAASKAARAQMCFTGSNPVLTVSRYKPNGKAMVLKTMSSHGSGVSVQERARHDTQGREI